MSELTTQLNNTSVSVFGNTDMFEQAQRMVVPLAKSTMVPVAYQNNPANCLVAMEMSHRIGKSVLEVMQNMHIVKGSAGWKSEYVIMSINRSGIFKEPLDFVFSDDRQSCYAVATRKSNKKELKGTTVSMELAKKEGWLDKTGSKWQTMPEQMLMYRAATFFCRVYCPEVLAGVQTQDEIVDIGYEPIGSTKVMEDLNSKIQYSVEETDFKEVDVTEAAKDIEVVHEVVGESEFTEYEEVQSSNQPATIQEDDDDF